MNHKAIKTFLIRLLVVFLIHFIFKIGDQSINVFSEFTSRGFVFSVFFTIYGLIVWYVSAFVNLKIQKGQESSSDHKKYYIFLLFSFHFIYGFAVSFLTNMLYRIGDVYFYNMGETWSEVSILNPEFTFSLFVIYIILFSFDVYYHSNIKSKEDQLQLEKLKQENTLAQYLNLKSQIEPHFLFNSLSVLSSLIQTDVNIAEEFLLRLSKTLRYVIEKNELPLVPLKDEVLFVEDYFFLIKNRFEEGIIFNNSMDQALIQNSYIPPASLQLLIENAVKHNKFTREAPLHIHISATENQIVVNNNINLRDDTSDSTKQGLHNLTQRFAYFSDKAISISSNEAGFTVSLPVLTKADYERINI
ncbi:MAG: hypothetical protein DRJ15_02945 [Bacteroidetes bacterium]|nr:MAG: hypothetical protein DRJ15_02945 [Bacteroidota bacterium]